jgi:uncharacterized protein YjdB
MKTWKRALRAFSPAAVAVIIAFGFTFTGCSDGNEETGSKDVAVTGVTLDERTLDLKVDETATLTATVAPKKATDKTVAWKSSDNTKATVTVDAATGVATVKGIAKGSAIITVTTTGKKADGQPATATCTVTVEEDGEGEPVPVTGVTLDEGTLDLEVGGEAELNATVSPEGTLNKDVTWLSSAPAVVSVTPDATDSRKAKVKALAGGTEPVIITVTTAGKKADGTSATAICTVTVEEEAQSVTGVTLTPTTLELFAGGGSKQLTPAVESEHAGPHDVTWKSSDTTKATVAADGTVTGVAKGTATITVTTKGKKANGQPATATCTVTVKSGMIEKMVSITAATFQMGSPSTEADRNANETRHSVILTKDFYMGATEVTQGEYFEITGDKPSQSDMWDDPTYNLIWEEYPVDSVTWFDAVEYCNKLSVKEGLTPVYTIDGRTPASGYPITAATVTANWNNNGYRLPTEAEWEYACRAGTTGPFNTGATITSYEANYDGSEDDPEGYCLGYPTYAGYYPPNIWGLYDMHGNVKEWCWDWYGGPAGYGTDEQTDPKGPETANSAYPFKILRGGSYADYGYEVRSAARSALEPFNTDTPVYGPWGIPNIGFRIVRNAPR